MEVTSKQLGKSGIQGEAEVYSDVLQYKDIVNSSHDNYLLIDRHYKIVAFNTRAAYSARFLFGKHLVEGVSIKEFYLENAYERFADDLKNVFSGKTIIRDEKLALPNKVIWFQFRFFPVYNKKNKVIRVAFHAIDITRFKSYKDSLKNERKLFEQGPAVAFKWTRFQEGSVTKFVSPNVKSILGYSSNELLGKSFLDFIHIEDVSRIRDSIKTEVANKLRQNDNSFIDTSYRVKCANGEYRWFNDYSFLAKESTDEELVYGYLIDVTEQKKTTEELKEKNKKLKETLEITKTQSKILEKTTNIVMFTDVECKITWVNKAFEKITQYSLSEALDKKFCELLIVPETGMEAMGKIQSAVNNKEKITIESINQKKDGEKFWVELKMEPIFGNKGDATAFLVILEDITDKREIEKQLEGRNEQFKKFSFTTSHELRHEFAKIMALLDNKELLLENGGELDLLKEIETAATNMNTVISKMNGQLHISDTKNDERIRELSLTDVDEICLVDDDDIVCFLNKKMLRSMLPDKKVTTFFTAEDALEYLKDSPDTIKRYIFLDLNMPVIDGWDFLEVHKELSNRAPVIILTSSIDSIDRQKAKKYPEVVSFLSKPLTKEKIETLV